MFSSSVPKYHARRGSKFVKAPELRDYLAVSAPSFENVLTHLGLRPNPAHQYDLCVLWRTGFGLASIPVNEIAKLAAEPLLTLRELAEIVGATAQTLRRAGDQRSERWNLPLHLDLGERLRRYLPVHIEHWLDRQPMPDWLMPRFAPSRAFPMRSSRSSPGLYGGRTKISGKAANTDLLTNRSS